MQIQTVPALDSEYRLDEQDIARFQRDGHVLLRGVLSAEEMADYRQAILGLVDEEVRKVSPAQQRDEYGRLFIQITHLWERDAAVAQFSLSPRLARIAARLLQTPALRIFHDQVLFKEPGADSTPWHQDGYYTPLDTDRIINMWMPLIDVSASMGTLQFASGSHRHGLLYDGVISSSSHAHLEQEIARRGWPVTEPVDMRAGDATFQNIWTAHRSSPNNSSQTREAITVLFFADGARVIDSPVQKFASKLHLSSRAPGELADAPSNPIVYSSANDLR